MEVLRKLFANPWFGGIASLASVISLIFGFYAYGASHESRDLNFVVDSAASALVKVGTTSKLSVNFDGKPISTDIMVAQIYIWNTGKLPIREENILEPIVLSTKGGVPILEATVRAVSRDLTKVNLNTNEMAKGKVGVSWAILEQGDGVRVQLVYAGDSNTQFVMNGTVEKPSSLVVQSKEALSGTSRLWSIGPVILNAIVAIFFFTIALRRDREIFTWVLCVLWVLLFIAGMWNARRVLRESPPPQALIKSA